MPGTVAFVCAMPMERRPLTTRLGLEKAEEGGLRVHRGRIGERPVVAVVTGMGTALATQGTQRLLDAVAPERVVVVGITGAVDDTVPIGSLVHPEVVVLGSSGREHPPAPLGTGVTPRGVMWTTDRITPPDELPGLRAKGVVALDMETAAVAHCCEQRDVPWSVFRAYSDRATDGSVDDEVFRLSNQDGTPNARAVARYFVRHPLALPRMAKMAKGAKLATETAAAAAIAAVQDL